jgi:hypothetical protein
MSRSRLVVAVLLVIVGLFWIGQGSGLLPGSAMSGQSFWALAGLALAVVGGVLLWRGLGPSARRP